jgi:hypothetical protein
MEGGAILDDLLARLLGELRRDTPLEKEFS